MIEIELTEAAETLEATQLSSLKSLGSLTPCPTKLENKNTPSRVI
jgi:hypothetical protein